MFAHTQNTDTKPDWLLFVILSVVLLLIVIFQSCEQKQPAAPQLTQEQLQRKQTVDSLERVVKIWESRRDSLNEIKKYEKKTYDNQIKIIGENNRLLLDVILKTLVKTNPRMLSAKMSRFSEISAKEGSRIYPPLKPSDITFYVINFKQKTVKKVQRSYPPQGKDLRTIFADSIAGYEKADVITGDFDGDGRQDVFDVRDDTISKRSKRITAFPRHKYLHPDWWFKFIRNEGDLDGDGADEIAIYLSNTDLAKYDIWSLKNGAWKYRLAVELSADMRAAGIVPVRKHPEKKGWVRIHVASDCDYKGRSHYVEEKDVKLRE